MAFWFRSVSITLILLLCGLSSPQACQPTRLRVAFLWNKRTFQSSCHPRWTGQRCEQNQWNGDGKGPLRFLPGNAARADETVDVSTERKNEQLSLDVSTTDHPTLAITSLLLQISYDGHHFNGWSAGNDKVSGVTFALNSTTTTNMPNATYHAAPNLAAFRSQESFISSSGRGRSRKRHNQAVPTTSGVVRSVQGVIASCLAKVYGNIDVSRIVVEGCSRTDKGVHATGMVTQIYCLTHEVAASPPSPTAAASNDTSVAQMQPSIVGKRLPHPWNGTDSTHFVPLPKPFPELVSTLNRMMPADVKIMAVASIPLARPLASRPFHPTLSANFKTYQYHFSVGPRHDPTQWRFVWHVYAMSNPDVPSTGVACNETAMQHACRTIQGQHNFVAFQGAARGADDKRKRDRQNTECTIQSIKIRVVSVQNETTRYVIDITGDRFLYKMVRFIVGSIVAVGRDKLTVESLQHMLSCGERSNVPNFQCAPAHGLVLTEVHYEDPIAWQPA